MNVRADRELHIHAMYEKNEKFLDSKSLTDVDLKLVGIRGRLNQLEERQQQDEKLWDRLASLVEKESKRYIWIIGGISLFITLMSVALEFAVFRFIASVT